MKFNKLRITGFKTFVEPTDLLIENGLTGIVGPNGCGKSNLVEAMRWVMGESSYKAMRASGMEEVIFSGSAKRPARHWAEVRLFLDNSERKAPAAFNEHEQLEVSRKIERDKGSNYRVNGREARARDVQLMFADAASGARSPSMVRQGQIGEIIAAKPAQRRALLEEAAGISGLHTRRHEAELRLKAAEANIERLDDVVAELDRQLDGLRKQARQAARFRDIAAKTRKVEAGVFALKWAEANSTANQAASHLKEATELLARADEGQLSAATAQASAAAQVPDAREKAAQAGAALGRLLRARDELASEEKRIAERLDTARGQLETLNADIARETGISSEQAAERAALEEDLKALDAARKAAQDQLPDRKLAAEKAQDELERALAASNAARDSLAAARAQVDAQKQMTARSQAQLADAEAKHAAARLAAEKLSSAQSAQQLANARQDAQAHKHKSESAAERAALAEVHRTEAMAAAAAAEQPLRAKEKAFNLLQAEVNTLEKLVGSQPTDSDPGREYGSVLDALTVEPGYEAALGAALGEALEAATSADAPHFWANLGDDHPDGPELPANVTAFARYVRGAPLLARALAQIGLVEPEQGDTLQHQLSAGQILVSKDGAVWRWDGYARKADAPSAAAIKLAERNRLGALRSDLAAAQTEVEALSQSHTNALEAMRQAGDAYSQARKDEADARRAYDHAANALVGIERAAEREAAQLAAAQGDLKRLEEALQAAQEAVAHAQTSTVEPEKLEALEAELRAASEAEGAARTRSNDAVAAAQAIERDLDDTARRVVTVQRALEGWSRRAEAAAAHSQTLARRKSELEATLEALDGAPGELVAKRRALAAQIEAAEAERGKTADRLAALEGQQRQADARAREIKEAYFAAREAHGRAEERKAAADERRNTLEAMIVEAVDAAPHALMAMAGFEPGMQTPTLEALEKELSTLKDARARIGAVNLAAEQEANEVAERRDMLVLERDDVAEAITKLRSTISTLNREGRAKLLEAFDRVNERFNELFVQLFGGGDAELQLVDADDPLDAGLEIIAKPPGKKPQSITLLSGGEQALTAMALIFAVFLCNPAPICILDEVDAPLDDANVERFCDLLDEMGKRASTRFLVVTHNPITMSRMQRLFGVTMAERGVSQIVSVDLADAEALVDAGSAA
ncbi:MAG: AAA family ATPase [Pseudomonadota bacterium]